MAINYAEQYSKELANAYGYSLYSGALWNVENANKYKVVDAKTIKIPTLTTGGRQDGDRTAIGSFTQNFSNNWETKTLSQHRIFQTLIHPQDVDQTNQVASIANITKTFNETQKFPEMDAYTFSTLYELKNAQEAITPQSAELTGTTAIKLFDELMDKMDEALVPATGRILYVDTYTKTLLDTAIQITRSNGDKVISRAISRLDEVEVVSVPTALLKTKYDFLTGLQSGFKPADDAENIAMILLHPTAILPVASYSFAQLENPSALTQGKYVYFEESFEDVFILNNRHDAIQIVVKNA